MANADVIKEFLVGLGFKIDENGLKKFGNGVAEATAKATAFAVAVEAAAAAVGAAVTKMADSMEKLYFASKRTGASVENMQALKYAASQMGVSAEEAMGSLEGLARFMRSNPGSSRFIESLGVATRDANGQLRDTSEIMADLGRKFKEMPYYRAKAYAGVLGIDEKTLLAMREGMGEFSDAYRKMYQQAGFDAQEASKSSHTFMVELRTLGTAFELLWQKVSLGLLKTLTPMVTKFRETIMSNFSRVADQLSKIMDTVIRVALFLGAIAMRVVEWFIALDQATDGWSTALAAALVAWRALNLGFMLTPIGAIITAIVALGAAIIALVDDYQTWKEGGLSLIDWSAYEPYIQKIKDTVVAIFEWFKGVTSQAVEGIMGAFKTLREWFEDFINWFREKWEWIEGKAEKAKEIASTVKQKVVQVVEDVKGSASEMASQTMAFFQKMGWSKAQAAGITANIQRESGFKANAVGDNGKAYGIAQWHPDRQREFEKWAGKRIQDATYAEQLAFMNHELTEGKEKRAGDRLRAAGTAGEAAAAVSTHYERPADKAGEAALRAKAAEEMFNRPGLTPSPSTGAAMANAGSTATINQKTEIKVEGASDPQATAGAVSQAQARVNGDLVRNTRGALS